MPAPSLLGCASATFTKVKGFLDAQVLYYLHQQIETGGSIPIRVTSHTFRICWNICPVPYGSIMRNTFTLQSVSSNCQALIHTHTHPAQISILKSLTVLKSSKRGQVQAQLGNLVQIPSLKKRLGM